MCDCGVTRGLTLMRRWKSNGRIGKIMRSWSMIISRSWPTIIAWSWPLIDLQRIKRPVFFARNLLIKSWSSLCKHNFWSNHEAIKRFLRENLSSSWSPASWLNRDPIGTGFNVINRWIRSNSPLECRMSAEEEIKPILFNPR